MQALGFERVTAGDLKLGDVAGKTKASAKMITTLERNANSVWLAFDNEGGRIRPGLTIKFWRRVFA